MANKMLIDATHAEETRVVVMRGNRVEEFDFETAAKKQLRGNIYLAKVTRVEPSLQAAFVEYGGNRHGFLAFSEIHPDYYQIPTADRQALLAEEAHAEAERARGEDRDAERAARGRRRRKPAAQVMAADAEQPSIGGPAPEAPEPAAEAADADDSAEENPEDAVEAVGGADVADEVPDRPHRVAPRKYKIQEVIRRRQVLLVQVVKEERGNKGAALTTYLSLAGRYSVLMPNTARGGGISRKITSADDRKRLKSIAEELEVPEGMGVILRTAGAARTKAEVKRDFEYLLRLWENVAELTLASQAPTLVYEEGSLVKRAIRDLYGKDIDEVVVAGDGGYKEAKDFMRMLMPSHAKNVKFDREEVPLFTRLGIESQLDQMFQPQVQLRSGGYIVINQTEALVSIDVNSGRSTREHNIEDTALKTNLEAAEEVARQLRLRDLAGLIVIDFIDMEENRNNRAVERRMKDCLKQDRARIQVGRISHFGLLEMSRQRIRTSVLESTMEVCPTCHGTGYVRSPSSSALQILRMIEEALIRDRAHNLTVRTRTKVALYVLNQKRANLRALEERFGVAITIDAEEHLPTGANYVIEKGELSTMTPAPRPATATAVMPPEVEEAEEPEVEETEVAEAPRERREARGDRSERAERPDRNDGEGEGGRRRRRRRRRRGGERDGGPPGSGARRDFVESGEDADGDDEAEDGAVETSVEAVEAAAPRDEDGDGDRRRRGRRGGRRFRERGEPNGAPRAERPVMEPVTWVQPGDEEAAPVVEASVETPPIAETAAAVETVAEEAPAAEAAPRVRRARRRRVAGEAVEAAPEAEAEAPAPAPEPAVVAPEASAPVEAAPTPAPAPEEPPAPVAIRIPDLPPVEMPAPANDGPRRAGWWNKR
jgi:ribonuclease E